MQYSDPLTLQGIKQDIYFLGKCNSTSISDDDMNRIVNKYYGQLQEVIRSVNENFYMIVAITDLQIGDGSYPYPDGIGFGAAPAYQKVKSIWAAFTPADITAPLNTEFSRVDIIDPDSVSDPSYVFTTPKAKIFGDYFVLEPLVTDVTMYPVTGGVKMYYIATIDVLVNDTDVPKIFVSFHDAITEGSLIDVHQRLGNTEAKKEAQAEFKKRLEEVKAYASSRVPDEVGIVEGQDGLGGWQYPWGNQSMA